MSITRFYYDPFTEFDRLFDDAFTARIAGSGSTGDGNRQLAQQRDGQGALTSGGSFKPRMDLHENPESNTVTATFELPGLRKEDVNIDVHNNRLTVSGEAKSTVENKNGENGYAVRERRYGSFLRAVQLPVGVKHEEIKAKMENGVLSVTFPKASSESAPKKITVS